MKKYLLLFLLFVSLSAFLSCDSGGGDDGTSYNFMTFTVDGVEKNYKSIEGNGFIHDTVDGIYWNVWDENWDADFSDYVIIEFPVSVTVGTYTESSPDFSFSLNLGGDSYSPVDFDLTITDWGAVGGMVKGTFSGTLSNGTTTLALSGSFEATNNTDQTE